MLMRASRGVFIRPKDQLILPDAVSNDILIVRSTQGLIETLKRSPKLPIFFKTAIQIRIDFIYKRRWKKKSLDSKKNCLADFTQSRTNIRDWPRDDQNLSINSSPMAWAIDSHNHPWIHFTKTTKPTSYKVFVWFMTARAAGRLHTWKTKSIAEDVLNQISFKNRHTTTSLDLFNFICMIDKTSVCFPTELKDLFASRIQIFHQNF